MKSKFVLIIFLLFTTAVPVTLLGRTDAGALDLPSIQVDASAFEANNAALRAVLDTPSALPRGPQDILNDYQAEMAGITERLSARVAAIAQAVQSGQLSSEQGQKLSTEQYQVAQMQFELLSAWRDTLEQDLARTPSAKPDPAASQASEIVMVALPFSSLQLDPSLAQYLDLTASQSRAIQKLMSDERRDLQPLMAQLKTTREKLLTATGSSQANEKEVKALAATQAGMLAKLIVANSRMQAQLYKLLNREQQRKLDDLKRSSEPMIASR
jgi:Spy/CpxP family protein refolding chaperone